MSVEIPENLLLLNSVDVEKDISSDGSDLVVRFPKAADRVELETGGEIRAAIFRDEQAQNEQMPSRADMAAPSPSTAAASSPLQSADSDNGQPVACGEVYHDVPVVGIGDQGDGVVKIDGLVVFISDGSHYKGDEVDIRITDVHDDFAKGELL